MGALLGDNDRTSHLGVRRSFASVEYRHGDRLDGHISGHGRSDRHHKALGHKRLWLERERSTSYDIYKQRT